RPPLASHLGGIPEIVHDGVSGILVPPDDPPALAAAMQELWNDGAEVTRMGANAWSYARAHFSPDRQAKHLPDLYGQLVQPQKGEPTRSDASLSRRAPTRTRSGQDGRRVLHL